MANCRASLDTLHLIIDVTNEAEVLKGLMNILEQDCDLSENEEYFQEDTLELGYDSEADRIIKEYTKDNGVPHTIEDSQKAFSDISEHISNQDFFGKCDIKFTKIDDTRLSVVFVTGGHYE